MINNSFTPHPLTAFRYLKRLLPLLIIPVTSSIYRYLLHGINFSATLWDVVGAILSILWAWREYKSISVGVKEGKILIKKGFVFKSQWSIPLDRLTAIHTQRTLLCLIFGGIKIIVETQAGRGKKADFEFYVNRRDLPRFVNCITNIKATNPIKSSLRQSVLLALSETSAWSGLLLFATAINYLGRFLGRKINTEVLSKLTDSVKKAGLIIPPVTATVAGLILIGFLLSFLVSVVHHLSHSVEQTDKIIHVKQGVLLRSHTYLFVNNIPCALAVSSPVLHFFSRKNLRLIAGGYNNKQEGESVLPAVPIDCDFFDKDGRCLTCSKKTIKRVVKIPLALTALCVFLLILFICKMPYLAFLWAILFLSLAFICLYRLKIRLHGVKKSFVILGKKARIYHPQRLTHFDSNTPIKWIDSFEIRQTPFDTNYKVCSLTMRIYNKKKSRFTAANLDYDDTISFLKGADKILPFESGF